MTTAQRSRLDDLQVRPIGSCSRFGELDEPTESAVGRSLRQLCVTCELGRARRRQTESKARELAQVVRQCFDVEAPERLELRARCATRADEVRVVRVRETVRVRANCCDD